MRTEARPTRDRKFVIVQAVLLLITVTLVVVCTIPFFQLIKDSIDRKNLASSLNQSDLKVASLEKNIMQLNAGMLMGGSDSSLDDEARKQLEELQRKLASVEVENQQMKQQMAMVSALLSLVNAHPAQTSPQADPGQSSPQTQPAQAMPQPQPVQTPPPAQPGQASSQAQPPTQTSGKGEVSKPPEAIIDNLVSAGDRITSMGEKITVFGDKMTAVLTKLIGTLMSFFTGIAVLLRWAKQKSGINTKTS